MTSVKKAEQNHNNNRNQVRLIIFFFFFFFSFCNIKMNLYFFVSYVGGGLTGSGASLARLGL
jgi:hypothetical protein